MYREIKIDNIKIKINKIEVAKEIIKLTKNLDKILSDKEYIEIISELLNNEIVLEMKKYRQHHKVSCYDHCLYVSYNTYLICKKYNLDYKSAARAGLLHDLFLYDWRKRQNGRKGLHAFTHPNEALKRASEITDLNDKEKDIIKNHMWPVTVKIPKYKETYIITLVDKYFAFMEGFIKTEITTNSIKKIVKEKEVCRKGIYNI